MSNSNFQKVKDFNTCFGSYISEHEDTIIFNKLPKMINLKYSLIKEEVDELNEAFNDDNVIEIIDALSDIKYVVYGMATALGIDMDKSFVEFLKSKENLNKLNLEYDEDKSDFQLTLEVYVSDFNNQLYYVSDYSKNIKLYYYKNMLSYYNNIINEMTESLRANIYNCDFKSVKNNLNQLLYYVNMFGMVAGIDLDESFNIVHDSNMTKVCQTEEIAKQTVDWYLENDKRYKTPTYKKNDFGYIILNQDTGKILKSIKYIPANFIKMLK